MKNKKIQCKYIFLLLVSVVFVVVSFEMKEQNATYAFKTYQDTKGEIIVIFQKELTENDLEQFVEHYNNSFEVVRHIGDYALLYIENHKKYSTILDNIRKDSRVKTAQINQEILILSSSDDADSNTQWAIDNPGHYMTVTDNGKEKMNSTKGIDMEVLKAWEYYNERNLKLREVVVAIIDTGVDYNHPELSDNMWINKQEIPNDGIDNDNNGYIDDINGWDFYNGDATICHYRYNKNLKLNVALPEDNDDHGTHVAGIIAAKANNKIGIAGIASNVKVKIMSLKINGGPRGSGDIASAIEAIKYATMMGANICNLSWGTEVYNEALEIVIRESDMLFVAAAGNTGSDNNIRPVYPASFNVPNMISVTFINSEGKLTPLSNYGTTTVDIAAPGIDIYSTIVGHYSSMSGSSMAVPHVTSIAAMLYSLDAKLYPSNIKNRILYNMKPIKSLNNYISNPGIPNAYHAMQDYPNIIRDKTAPELIFRTIHNLGKFIVPVYADDFGGSDIRVIRYIIGKRELEEFKRGTVGTRVEENQVVLSKPGFYTFYVSDYAGNEAIQVYEVIDDKSPPQISVSYVMEKDYRTAKVTLQVTDNLSGLKRVKYAEGVKSATEMLPASSGKELFLVNDKITFKVKAPNTYTIFATDYRGNNAVFHVKINVIKAEQIKFLRSTRVMKVGEKYIIPAFLKPANTTDKITYTSSNASVVTVSGSGKLTAIKPGKAVITAKTTSGKKTTCTITVKK